MGGVPVLVRQLGAVGIQPGDVGGVAGFDRLAVKEPAALEDGLPVPQLDNSPHELQQFAAAVARYMRSGMLEQIRQDYVRTARAKGLSERKVVFKHAMRNALIPVVTLLGLYIPFLMSGAVLIETIFAWPGMGRTIVTAIFQRDYPVVLASAFVIAVLVILGNLLADILYSVVDPRVRVEDEAT